MSFHDAALKILKEEGKPMTAEEITQRALQKGMINTKGKTPAITLAGSIYKSIRELDERSPFVKVAKGKFGLRSWEEESRDADLPKHTFKETALIVLKEEGKPLDYKTITEIALKKGYLKTAGKTPAATMGAEIYSDIKENGARSPFVKVGKNRFALREWNLDVIKSEIEEEKE